MFLIVFSIAVSSNLPDLFMWEELHKLFGILMHFSNYFQIWEILGIKSLMRMGLIAKALVIFGNLLFSPVHIVSGDPAGILLFWWSRKWAIQQILHFMRSAKAGDPHAVFVPVIYH